ncbi:unnamed protein product [Prorocentrum cordatum]|uniref:Uncharacterized protein n=1 Tax=Prorocentrum cordatum TaxID=2364126 RepID=A0ABN9U409_9DINO|nr:unnamed protein product [Polarella glacialis]
MADAADASAGPRPRTPVAAGPALAPHFARTKPLLEHSGALAVEGPFNLALDAPNSAVRMGGAFSFMCTLRMDGTGSWSRVFDFSLTADEDSITAGAVGLTNDLHFTVFRGKKPFSVVVSNFFELGTEVTMLCTVTPSGHMRVFKDGALVGENEEGMAPLRQDRPRMILGGHYLYAGQEFHGSLRDAKLWNQEVAWHAPESAGAPLGPKAGGPFLGDADTASSGTGGESWDAESSEEGQWHSHGLTPAGGCEEHAAAVP